MDFFDKDKFTVQELQEWLSNFSPDQELRLDGDDFGASLSTSLPESKSIPLPSSSPLTGINSMVKDIYSEQIRDVLLSSDYLLRKISLLPKEEKGKYIYFPTAPLEKD